MARRCRSPTDARKEEIASKLRRVSEERKERAEAKATARAERDARRWVGFEEAEFCDEGGVQRVAPYAFSFTAFAKSRWFGRTVLDVLSDEFNAYSSVYFRSAIESGRILVNDVVVKETFTFSNNDRLLHTAHRHEPPVRNSVGVVKRTSDYVVVDKPSSLPVHPCGRYRFNSVVYVLARTHQLQTLPVHRLDRLTSGVLLLALSAASARKLADQIQERSVSKFYLARVNVPTYVNASRIPRLNKRFVQGEFPLKGDVDVTSCTFEAPADICSDVDSQWSVCDKPLVCVDHRMGKFDVGESGKACRTEFRRLSFNGRTSVVLCRPLTGRTHQIRVHLRSMGFPIANDPCYGGKLCLGNTVLSTGDVNEELVSRFETKVREDADAICPECCRNAEQYIPADPVSQGGLFCTEIWLHALCYAGEGWSEAVPPPAWAHPSFQDEEYLTDSRPEHLKHIY